MSHVSNQLTLVAVTCFRTVCRTTCMSYRLTLRRLIVIFRRSHLIAKNTNYTLAKKNPAIRYWLKTHPGLAWVCLFFFWGRLVINHCSCIETVEQTLIAFSYIDYICLPMYLFMLQQIFETISHALGGIEIYYTPWEEASS